MDIALSPLIQQIILSSVIFLRSVNFAQFLSTDKHSNNLSAVETCKLSKYLFSLITLQMYKFKKIINRTEMENLKIKFIGMKDLPKQVITQTLSRSFWNFSSNLIFIFSQNNRQSGNSQTNYNA